MGWRRRSVIIRQLRACGTAGAERHSAELWLVGISAVTVEIEQHTAPLTTSISKPKFNQTAS